MGNYASFHGRCLDWLRSERSLRTAILPENKLCETPDELVRVRGFFARPSSSGDWAFVGLCGLVLATVLTGLAQGGLAGLAQGARPFVGQAAYVVLICSVLAFVVAELLRRRKRLRATIELRCKDSPPLTPKAVEELRREAVLGAAWFLSEIELSPETLTRAAQLGVRCFVAKDKGFEERSVFLKAQSEGRPPKGGQAGGKSGGRPSTRRLPRAS